MLVADNPQANLIYGRSGELDDGLHPFLTKLKKKYRCYQLLIGYFSTNFIFYPDITMQAPYQ